MPIIQQRTFLQRQIWPIANDIRGLVNGWDLKMNRPMTNINAIIANDWGMNKELQFLIYNTPQEDIKVDVVVRDETIWLTQKAMATLFDVQVPAITKHLKNIFEEGELHEEATISKMEIVQNEGGRDVKRNIDFYNLDAIISVGYRVNSAKATQFRIWATKTLKEFIQKGFVLDDERLKQGESVFGKDYFRDFDKTIKAFEKKGVEAWPAQTIMLRAVAEWRVEILIWFQLTKTRKP